MQEHAHHNTGEDRSGACNGSANGASPEKLLERMLGGAGEPAAPFGLIRGERRAAKRATLELEQDLASRIKNRAAILNVSMESLAYLAWSLILARFCGQDGAIFGAALPPFTKVFPVRIDAAASPARSAARETHELLAQIRAFLPAWGAHEPDGDPGAAYSLPALFGYNLPENHVWAAELSGGVWPLAVIVAEAGETFQITAWAQYPADPATVCAYMRTALERLAGTLETAPGTPAASIDAMPEEERRKLLIEWNATGTAYPRDKCIHHLFEEQAARTPDAVAVVHDGHTLTYSQLNARANQLAHHLRGLGVGPEARVAICVERSLEMIVGLLATLKAGGAYVPLDPAYPVERLRFTLNDSAPAVLLVDDTGRAALREAAVPAEVIDLGGETPSWADRPEPDLSGVGTLPTNLAYIIYTSGSTGTPKGVMIEHANVSRLFSATAAWFNFGPDDVWTLFHSFAFDFSVWEIWGALLYGGRLVIIPKITAQSPEKFYQLLCGAGVTVLNQTPSSFRQLMTAQASNGGQHRLRLVIFGGEALETSSLKPWFELAANRHTQLVNMYGITETTVHVTYYPLTPAGAERRGASPIGCRIPDLRVYILDANRQPAPAGVTGELYVGGEGVARGYLNRPELTAERFVADPFSAEPGARMYKTGDLGRWTADGAIEYLGRNDFQVKIRGFRIELGEIEARLAEYQGVREPVVIAREDSTGDKRLVAYYVAGANIGQDALRAHLLAKLPEYMVPAAYVRLDRMPLTHNGKLDRTALPAPDSSAYGQDSYEAPVGPAEEKLAQIWASILGFGGISRNASFFDIGGHSLLAVRMLTLIEAELGHSLNLTSLFRAPSIAALAQLLQQEISPGVSSPYVVAVQPEGTKPPLFAINTPSIYYGIAKRLGKNQPLIGLQLFNPAQRPEFKHFRLEDVAGEYVKLIRETQPQGPYAIMGWCVGGVLAFETAQQLIQMGQEVSFTGIIDARAPDYIRRRGAAWVKAADYATRYNQNYAEMRAGRQNVLEFLRQIGMTKPLTRLYHALHTSPQPVSYDPELQTIEQHNNEMIAYLWGLQGIYEPKLFPGRLHVFISQFEATGWLVDSSLGWGRLASEGAEAVTVTGNHKTIFKDPGASQIAAAIAAAVEPQAARNPSKAPSRQAAVRANSENRHAEITVQPLVSVIIPAYNAEQDIAQAIGCAIAQTYPEIEIVVVDDGSQDGTVQTARETLKSSFKGRWSVLELGTNRGASAARNAAVKQAKGEWIQFLDSDDAIAADKIELQMKQARTAGPDISAIYSSWRHVYLEDGKFVPAGPLNTPRYEDKHPLMFFMYYASLHHGACLIRRSALERIQGFDETMRTYEDADLLARLAKEAGRFQFAASSGPSYLWRLYNEQPREGGEEARYKLQDTAMNWIRLVKRAAGNRQIGDILSSPDDMIVWRQHCASYARRLHESGAGTFKLFMDELQKADPDFTYP